ALTATYTGSDRVAVSFFGDGGANQGTLHESMNLAAIWKLPVLFVCENNQYAETNPVKDAFAVEDISLRAAGYGMPGVRVNGQDVREPYRGAAAAGGRLCRLRKRPCCARASRDDRSSQPPSSSTSSRTPGAASPGTSIQRAWRCSASKHPRVSRWKAPASPAAVRRGVFPGRSLLACSRRGDQTSMWSRHT